MRLLMNPVTAHSVVGSFAVRLLATDLPDLPASRRTATGEFVAHRIDTLPSLTRFGVLAIGSVFRALLAAPGGWVVARVLLRLPLPLVSEYPRLIRSLAFAYVWETWPSTSPTGLAA